jgi:hypothetical protein
MPSHFGWVETAEGTDSVKNEIWLGDVDSNHDKQSQSLLSYR